MPKRDPGPSVKDPDLYEKLRDEGDSKEKAARIANAAAGSSRTSVGRKGGKAGDYEDWTVEKLRKRAAEIGIEGRSSMRKAELLSARCARTEYTPGPAGDGLVPDLTRGATVFRSRPGCRPLR